jgi:hypothetical protein
MEDEADGTGEPGVDEHGAGEPGVGDSRVDEALRRLDGLGDLPTSEHPAVFERVHGQLVEVLGGLRSGADQSDGRTIADRSR